MAISSLAFSLAKTCRNPPLLRLPNHHHHPTAISGFLTRTPGGRVLHLNVSTTVGSSWLNKLRSSPPVLPLFLPHRSRSPPAAAPAATVRSLFTGIVEEMGRIEHLGPSADGGFDMTVSASTVLGGVQLGDSIAINGTCLTVTRFDASGFTVGLSPETLRKTSLGELGPGSPVNLERALRPDSRMGGHFVQGHVDGTGEILSLVPERDTLWVKVRAPPELLRYVVPKGFIAVDGTSLTVVGVYEEEGCFDFMLVAYTQQKVVIPLKKVGDKVNLEVDILGKYVERLLKSGLVTGGGTTDNSYSAR